MGQKIILEDLFCITLADVNKHLNTKAIGRRTRTVQVKYRDPSTGHQVITHSFQLTINIDQGNDFLQIEYSFGNKSHVNIVPLIACKANLGRGIVYWFQDSFGYKCRKLFFAGNNFVSCKALNHTYRQQTESRKKRNRMKTIRTIRRYQKIVALADQKYYMAVRAGRATIKKLKVDRAKGILNSLS